MQNGIRKIISLVKKRRSNLRKTELVREVEGEEGEELQTLRVWFFAHDGFITEDAEVLMLKKGCSGSYGRIWTGCSGVWGLRQLPDIADKKDRR